MEIAEMVGRDGTWDGGSVADLVRLDGERAGTVEVGGEFSGRGVEIVAQGAFGEETDGEVVRFEDVVGGEGL